MSTVIVHKRVAKYYRRLPEDTKVRLIELLKELEEKALKHPDVKRMVGDWNGYHRLRVGKMRVIFWLDEKEDVIYVDYIGARGDVL
jgi:mRNA interferase RelE/StbE